MVTEKRLKTNAGPVAVKAVLRKNTQVAPDGSDGPLVVLPAGTKASSLSERQLAQLSPDHFTKEN